MALQFRQGPDSERLAVTPAQGEPIWITDTKKLYIGDGSTAGGVEITGGGGGGTTSTFNTATILNQLFLGATQTTYIDNGDFSTDIRLTSESGGIRLSAGQGVFLTGGANRLHVGNIQSGGSNPSDPIRFQDEGENDVLTIQDSTITVYQQVLPATDGTIDLGAPDRKFRSLYLTSSTLYLDQTPISVTDGTISVDNNPIAIGNQVLNTSSVVTFAGVQFDNQTVQKTAYSPTDMGPIKATDAAGLGALSNGGDFNRLSLAFDAGAFI